MINRSSSFNRRNRSRLPDQWKERETVNCCTEGIDWMGRRDRLDGPVFGPSLSTLLPSPRFCFSRGSLSLGHMAWSNGSKLTAPVRDLNILSCSTIKSQYNGMYLKRYVVNLNLTSVFFNTVLYSLMGREISRRFYPNLPTKVSKVTIFSFSLEHMWYYGYHVRAGR